MSLNKNTELEVLINETPVGTNMIPTRKNKTISFTGVKIGCHIGNFC